VLGQVSGTHYQRVLAVPHSVLLCTKTTTMAAAAASGGGGSSVCASPAAGPSLATAAATAPAPATGTAAAPAVSTPLAYGWDDQLELRGHSDNVESLALLPGGRLASGDDGGTVRLWDVARGGDPTAVLEGHDARVLALVALPDGRRLVAAANGRHPTASGTIVVWDTGVMPPTRCATIDCGRGLNALAVLRDGRFATGFNNGDVRLVEVNAGAGAVTATLKGHVHVVAALAVLPDGTLASGAWDHTVRLWDVGAAVCVATLAEHTGNVNALAVLADGRLASGSDDKTVRLWDVVTRTCVGVLKGHTYYVLALAPLPDGRLASGSADSTLRVWDTRPPAAGVLAMMKRVWRRTTPVVVLEGHGFHALQPLPGGRLASGWWDRGVNLWRVPPL